MMNRAERVRLVHTAAVQLDLEMEHFPETPQCDADVLLSAAAWLDFYDTLWPIIEDDIGIGKYNLGISNELQQMLREIVRKSI